MRAALKEGLCSTLEAVTQVCNTYDLTVNSIRPCVGAMLNTRFYRGSFPNRSEACLIIALELKKAGKDQESALSVVDDWNQKNIHPKGYSDIRSTVNTAFAKEYNYTCRNEKLKSFCIGEDICTFHKHIEGRTGKYYNNRKFFEFGWQNILSNVAKCVYYLALPELERRKGVGAGGLIIASQLEISQYAGVTTKSVRSGFSELQIVGLIEYQPGVSRKWEFKASEIRRIIPIPKPSIALLARREK